MDFKTYAPYGPTILRIVLGLMFLLSGIGKLMNIAGPTGFFTTLGIPAAGLMAWIVGIVELLGGLVLLAGWRLEWAVWPLIVVMLVAIVLAVIPGITSIFQATNLWFHLLAIGALLTLAFTGPGKWAVNA